MFVVSFLSSSPVGPDNVNGLVIKHLPQVQDIWKLHPAFSVGVVTIFLRGGGRGGRGE